MLNVDQDYEMDALNNLKKILSGKWDFVTMQAEEQVHTSIAYHSWGLLAPHLAPWPLIWPLTAPYDTCKCLRQYKVGPSHN